MPLIIVETNASLDPAQKRSLAVKLTDVFTKTLHTAAAHTHVQVTDNQFLSLGGNPETPASVVTIKAADSSITKDARKSLVAGISEALPQHLQCLSGDRIYMIFEEHPVQNFAVGDSIMTFDTMHTANSVENFAEVAP
ncbi:Tautomerase/MIF superfamily [Scenedesmus sp. NREL 46B-D3]|nr:Tautomerase/MIF superfamily [Scenedesmus sp. NREL 46B-D3]